MRKRREEWRRLVDQWGRSGQTVAVFAAKAGVNARTLQYWKYAIAREGRSENSDALESIVEIRGAAAAGAQFELDLRGGRRLRVPAAFDADALTRLLAILEPTP